MSAIDETWTANLCGNACECASSISTDAYRTAGQDDRILFSNDGGGAFAQHPRLKIAACAPEALRMLVMKEWRIRSSCYERGCMWCDADEPKGHDHDCVLLALMVKAGLRQSPPEP